MIFSALARRLLAGVLLFALPVGPAMAAGQAVTIYDQRDNPLGSDQSPIVTRPVTGAPNATVNQGAPNAGGTAAWYVQWSGQSIAVSSMPAVVQGAAGTAPWLVAWSNQSVAVSALPSLPAGTNVIGAVTQSGGPWTISGTVAATQSGPWTVSLGAGSTAVGTVGVTALPPIPAGSATIGKVGIDQSGFGTSNGVSPQLYYDPSAGQLGVGGSIAQRGDSHGYGIAAEAGSANAIVGITPAVTQSGTSLVGKGSAGNLYAYAATNLSTTAGFVAVINATATPTSGAAIAPLECRILPASGATDKSYDPGPPPAFSTGVVVLISTSCSTYTPGGAAFINALVR